VSSPVPNQLFGVGRLFQGKQHTSVCVNPKRAHLIIENATTLGLFSLDVIIQNAST